MNHITSPKELSHSLRKLLATVEDGTPPSRNKMAEELRGLAEQVSMGGSSFASKQAAGGFRILKEQNISAKPVATAAKPHDAFKKALDFILKNRGYRGRAFVYDRTSKSGQFQMYEVSIEKKF